MNNATPPKTQDSGIDQTGVSFTIAANVSIVKLISDVILSSDYIRKQFPADRKSNPTDNVYEAMKTSNGDSLNWFKILPIMLNSSEYDSKNGKYPATIVYHIQKYIIYNTKLPFGPIGLPTPDKIVKQYNYMYTGKNMDILDLTIDMNTQYYVAITANPVNIGLNNINNGKSPKSSSDAESDKTFEPVPPNGVNPAAAVKQTGLSAKSDIINDPRSVYVSDMNTMLMAHPSADMVTVELKIIGDPQFIKQDDISYAPTGGQGEQMQLTENNSIRTDYSEIFVRLNFMTPVDYNYNTGLTDSVPMEKGVFSGLYKVISVSNMFNHGKFEQTLNLVRLFAQDFNFTSTKADNGQRT